MKLFDKIWNNLDGAKTILGGLLHAVWFLYYAIFNKDISVEHQITGHTIIGVLTGVGILHKAQKYIDNKKQNGKGD